MAQPDWAGLIGYKTRAQLMDWAEQRWTALGGTITDWNVGGPFRTVVEMGVEMAAVCHDLALAVVPQGLLAYAEGVWLNLKAAEVGVTPQVARKAQWRLVVGRVGTSGNVVIPAHSRFRTRTTAVGDVLVFDQPTQVILPDGQSQVQVLVDALEVGSQYNVAPGAICEFVTAIPGVTTVTNPAGSLVVEGTDDEQPEKVRERGQLQWPSLSRGVVREAYIAFARQVDGVVDVDVDDQHPRGDGTVDVIITGAAGAPTPDLLAAVHAYITARIPQCVGLLVRGPVTWPTSVHLRVVIPLDRGEVEATEAAVTAVCESLLATGAMPAVPRLGIGKSLRRTRLVDLASEIDPVFDVEVLAPAQNVLAGPGELVVLDGPVVVEVVRQRE